MNRKYRVGIIGSTNRGGYGHGMDTAFKDEALFEIIAIADDDPAGLAATGKRLGVTRLYADYRELLAKEKPDIVAIGPRWLTDRVAMVTAAAAAGCHIFLEKPLAATLRDADAMLAACNRAKVKCALAHQLRAMPPVRAAFADIRAGKYGKILRLFGQPSDDARGGGEELIVHGTHFFDLMISLAGAPRWVSAHLAVGDRDATPADKREGREPVGPIAGDSAAVMIGFDHGVRGFWNSTANLDRHGSIYGLVIQCEQATVCMRTRGEVFVYPGSGDRAGKRQARLGEDLGRGLAFHQRAQAGAAERLYPARQSNARARTRLRHRARHRADREPARCRLRHRDHPGRVCLAFRGRETAVHSARRP